VTQAAIERLQQLSDRKKSLSEYDKRAQDTRQLAEIYGRWSALVAARRGDVLHSLLGSLSLVIAVLLAIVLIDRAIGRAFRQTDRRRLDQLRTISKLAVQLAGFLIVLLIVFGPPTQMTTIIGLATAGLTVALKDFIVGFVGWFVLLGRNGIHVGDWVEIEGVGGEVIEIGLLRTVLLEVGNWTTTGHPTGRRVAFLNSFAIEGHFFNFSTAGQWLWDQIRVTLPAASDPYRTADRVREMVANETQAEVREAEQDWQRVTAQYGIREFSAKPAVELQPSASGLDLVVRYITRAPQRSEVKSRLFRQIVNLLHQPAGASA
jgi:small-conductance mechanosensitive channel